MPERAHAHLSPAQAVWIPACAGMTAETPGMSFPRRRESIGFQASLRMSAFTEYGYAPPRTQGRRPGGEAEPHV